MGLLTLWKRMRLHWKMKNQPLAVSQKVSSEQLGQCRTRIKLNRREVRSFMTEEELAGWGGWWNAEASDEKQVRMNTKCI